MVWFCVLLNNIISWTERCFAFSTIISTVRYILQSLISITDCDIQAYDHHEQLCVSPTCGPSQFASDCKCRYIALPFFPLSLCSTLSAMHAHHYTVMPTRLQEASTKARDTHNPAQTIEICFLWRHAYIPWGHNTEISKGYITQSQWPQNPSYVSQIWSAQNSEESLKASFCSVKDMTVQQLLCLYTSRTKLHRIGLLRNHESPPAKWSAGGGGNMRSGRSVGSIRTKKLPRSSAMREYGARQLARGDDRVVLSAGRRHLFLQRRCVM